MRGNGGVQYRVVIQKLHRIMAMDIDVFTVVVERNPDFGIRLVRGTETFRLNLSECHFGQICGDQSGTETVLSWRTSVVPCQHCYPNFI